MSKLVINFYGSPKDREFPIISVRLNNQELYPEEVGFGPFEVSGVPTDYTFELEDTGVLEIEYYNDDTDEGGVSFGDDGNEDRNLFINSLSLNGEVIPWESGSFKNTTPWGGEEFGLEPAMMPNPNVEGGGDNPRVGTVWWNGIVTYNLGE